MFLIFGFLNEIFGDTSDDDYDTTDNNFTLKDIARDHSEAFKEIIQSFVEIQASNYKSYTEKTEYKIPKIYNNRYDEKVKVTGIGSDFFKELYQPSIFSRDILYKISKNYGYSGNVVPQMINSMTKKIIIPNSVKIIKRNAFSGYRQLENLKTIIIPDSVTEIGSGAFYNIQHIEYHGSASGAPWGAKSMN